MLSHITHNRPAAWRRDVAFPEKGKGYSEGFYPYKLSKLS